ncbi:hypothetical protein ARMSODRAFT_1057979 [Armillaria solidipes]|uniref:Uncharacterized protein n=1 Tax=Armillaria solidipes TaxID=1076256 RepID=A0A2H3B1D2_9AGAR|nr:hypothetical protein ARMSODRAFT_1057979 [Armillaria solidipes]
MSQHFEASFFRSENVSAPVVWGCMQFWQLSPVLSFPPRFLVGPSCRGEYSLFIRQKGTAFNALAVQFLSYSLNPNHSSRRSLRENDVESLEERFPVSDLSISPIERKARGPNVIHEERQENTLYPLHYAIIEQNTPDITTIGLAEDLNNTDNIEGVILLDGVLGSMQSNREFMLSMWQGNPRANRSHIGDGDEA